MNKNILITIAARGGSKGIKNKNIRMLMGKPLIYYTIKQALDWKKASHVVVTTDSEKIADYAKKYKAEVPFKRPRTLATDKAGKVDVIKHALLKCEKLYKEKFDIVVDLDVTAPVRTIKDLDMCLKLFLKYKPNCLLSVVHAQKNPYFNMLEKNNGRIDLCKKINGSILRRQDAPEVFSANASIYFYDRDYLAQSSKPSVINDNSRLYIMPEASGIDIDREIDFDFLEFLVKRKKVKI